MSDSKVKNYAVIVDWDREKDDITVKSVAGIEDDGSLSTDDYETHVTPPALFLHMLAHGIITVIRGEESQGKRMGGELRGVIQQLENDYADSKGEYDTDAPALVLAAASSKLPKICRDAKGGISSVVFCEEAGNLESGMPASIVVTRKSATGESVSVLYTQHAQG